MENSLLFDLYNKIKTKKTQKNMRPNTLFSAELMILFPIFLGTISRTYYYFTAHIFRRFGIWGSLKGLGF